MAGNASTLKHKQFLSSTLPFGFDVCVVDISAPNLSSPENSLTGLTIVVAGEVISIRSSLIEYIFESGMASTNFSQFDCFFSSWLSFLQSIKMILAFSSSTSTFISSSVILARLDLSREYNYLL